ncbi:MAG: maleylacetoacetate isomerase [Bdellovibrionales bacterium]|nr:maleylacetoacetate isomerase [Bdellovibrionales bacterium]
MTQNPSLKLYSYFRSSASYRVRIALNLKSLNYEYIPVHLVKDGGEQHKDEYKNLNPSAELPTLLHGDKTLSQSMAIILYLDEVLSDFSLFPQDTFQKAKVIQACEIVNSGIQPLQNLKVLKSLTSEFGLSEEKKLQWIQKWIRLGLHSFEHLITHTSGQHCFGDTPSAADAFLIPQIYNAKRFEIVMEEFPLLNKIDLNCQKLEAFKKSAPEQQPDAPA